MMSPLLPTFWTPTSPKWTHFLIFLTHPSPMILKPGGRPLMISPVLPTFWTPTLFRNSKSKLLYLRKPLNMILLFWRGATLPQKPTSWKFCFEKHCWSSVFFCVGDLLKERSQHFLGIGSWAQSVWTHRIQSVHSFSHFSRIFLLVRPTQVRGLGAPNTFDSF